MPAYLSPLFNLPEMDANGAPLSGGKVFTYLAGTTTPATTYTSSTAAVPQTNPIILNSRGVPDNPIWLAAGTALKFVLQDASGNVLAPTYDNILGINDPVGVTAQDEWVTYSGVPTFLSATSFSVPGDQRATFEVKRRLKSTIAAGVAYSTITASAFGAGVTTVTVSNTSGVLNAGLTAVAYGLLSVTNPSVPVQPGELLGFQKFTANGTYTPSNGVGTVIVEIIGGGGAGGGAATTAAGQYASGGGGGAGWRAASRFAVATASGAVVTIGAGGVAVSGAGGGNGGTSSFGALLSAPGGNGGTLGSAVASGTVTVAGGGAGGIGGTVGTIEGAPGQGGGYSLYLGGGTVSGAGATSRYGGGGVPVSGTSAGSNASSSSYGAGGSGGALLPSVAATIGGNGAPGVCIVWEYA